MLVGNIEFNPEKRPIWGDYLWGAGMEQWRERLPPTNVTQVRFPGRAVICGLSLLLALTLTAQRVFLGFTGFPTFTKINTSKVHVKV